jgi:hypothetical protein
MGWTAPKTWSLNDILGFADLNTYLRDNMNFLFGGFHRILLKEVRNQTSAISVGTAAWTDVDSGGLEHVLAGAVLEGDILEVSLSAMMGVAWSNSIAIYDDTTLLVRLSARGGAANEAIPMDVSYEFTQAYADIHVYMSVYPTSASSILAGTAPEIYGWMSVTHLRPPTV